MNPVRAVRFAPAVAGLLLGGAVEAQDATAGISFDHQHERWDGLLREHVHEGGLVDYRGLAGQRGRLDAYLRELERVGAEAYLAWSAAQQEAFWINAYNAYTVQLILDHYPVDSIKDLGGWFTSVFDRRFVPLQELADAHPGAAVRGEKPLSLGEIEHGVLGRVARTPMFHFAIVCASKSCPRLLDRAYRAEDLDETLAAQARRFLSDPAKNDVRVRDGTLRLSKIFDWSEHELKRYPGGIPGLLRDHGPGAVARHADLDEVRIRYRDYDWSLNEWLPKASKR